MARFFGWRLALYVIFVLIAAPLQYHVEWFAGWQRHNEVLQSAMQSPLVRGELFFYSVILVVEAAFRIAGRPELHVRSGVRFAYFWASILVMPFILYLIKGVDSILQGGWIKFEWYVTLASLLFSLVVYIYMHKLDRIKDPAAEHLAEGLN